MDYVSQRKNVRKAAEARFPGQAMQWQNGHLCFVATGLTVEGTPHVPKPKKPEPEPSRPHWTERYAPASGTTRTRPASRPSSWGL